MVGELSARRKEDRTRNSGGKATYAYTKLSVDLDARDRCLLAPRAERRRPTNGGASLTLKLG